MWAPPELAPRGQASGSRGFPSLARPRRKSSDERAEAPPGAPDDLSEAAIRELLAARAAARRAVPLDQLWIRVDSQVPSRPRATGDGGVSIITGELDDFVEISAVAGSK